MAASHLTAVPAASLSEVDVKGEVVGLSRPSETGAQRLRRLQLEARALAREQVEAVAHDFDALVQNLSEIADGGEAFPPGVRDLAARIAADLPMKAQLLTTLMGRLA
jgi:hypothetical protein